MRPIRFLHNLAETDVPEMMAINRTLCECGGVCLFGVHMFYFGKTPQARKAEAERIFSELRIKVLDAATMAAQMERYHHGLVEMLNRSKVPVGIMLEGLEEAVPLPEAENLLQESWDYLHEIDRSGRQWLLAPTEKTNVNPLYQDRNRFLQTAHGGIGVRQPVLCGCSFLVYSNGDAVDPDEEPENMYGCVNGMIKMLDDSDAFDGVRWEPSATHTRIIPF